MKKIINLLIAVFILLTPALSIAKDQTFSLFFNTQKYDLQYSKDRINTVVKIDITNTSQTPLYKYQLQVPDKNSKVKYVVQEVPQDKCPSGYTTCSNFYNLKFTSSQKDNYVLLNFNLSKAVIYSKKLDLILYYDYFGVSQKNNQVSYSFKTIPIATENKTYYKTSTNTVLFKSGNENAEPTYNYFSYYDKDFKSLAEDKDDKDIELSVSNINGINNNEKILKANESEDIANSFYKSYVNANQTNLYAAVIIFVVIIIIIAIILRRKKEE